MTAILNMHGYEGRGVGIKMRDSVNSASGASNREWFVGTGYGQSGFNIGYASDGSQSSYAAQAKLSISTSGNATFAGNLTVGSDTNEQDFIVYGNDTGEKLMWDGSESKLLINHDTDDSGLEIYTVGSAVPTSHQIKIGRDNGQYLGIRVV